MITLTAEERDVFGKKLASARAGGRLPVVVYGATERTAPFFVAVKDFKKVLSQAGESTVISLKTDAGAKEVLIHDVAWHPVSGEPVHADFYVVDKTKVIRVEVPLNFIGVAPAVKEQGGTLVKVLHQIEVEALPMQIPSGITIDISKLAELDSQILVRDLVPPPGVQFIPVPDEVVAAISVAKEEEAPSQPVDLAAIEVEKKGKKEEDEAAEPPNASSAPSEN